MSGSSQDQNAQQRLEALDARLAAARTDLAARGPVPDRHRAKLDELERKKTAIYERLMAGSGIHGRRGRPAKGEIDRDIEILFGAFDRWTEDMDKEFTRNR